MAKGRATPWAAANFCVNCAQLVGGLDGDLVGEDVVAVIVAELLALGVEKAGIDGGLEAPGMVGQREVMAHPGDVVLGGGLHEVWVGGGADGALHVSEFDDSDAGAGGRLEGGGVVDLRGLRRAELGVGGGRGEEQRGRDEGQGEMKAGTAGTVGRVGKCAAKIDRMLVGRLPKPIVTAGMGEIDRD